MPPSANIVVLIANGAYIPGAFVAAASLVGAGLRDDIAIAIVHPPGAFTATQREWLDQRHPRIRLVEVGAQEFLPEELSAWDTALAPLFLRFALSEIFPSASRILYVDSDILCVGSIADAFALDLRGKMVAAAHDDLVAGLVGHKASWTAYRNALGVAEPIPYLNCGLLLIDAVVWREQNIKQALVSTFLTNRQRCRYFDQSAINLFLKGDFAPLSPAWNFQQNYQAIGAEDIIRPRLLHFAGSAKPWRNDGFVFRAPYRERYKTLLGATPFASFFEPYSHISVRQAKEGWRSLNRRLRGKEIQSGIRRRDIGPLREKLMVMMSGISFIDS